MSETATVNDATDESVEKPARKVDPGFARNIKIIVAIVLSAIVAVVLMIFVLNRKAQSDSGVNIDAMSRGSVSPRRDEPTPAMQKKLEGAQQMEADQALQEGKTYIPKESIGSTMPVGPVPMPAPGSSMIQTSTIYAPPVVDKQQQDGMRLQLGALFPSTTNQGAVRQTLEVDRNAPQARPAEPPAANTVAPIKPKVLIPALEILVGKMTNPINVGQGKTTFASGNVTVGKFAGAYLIGTATMNEAEAIEVNFKEMRHNGKPYKIDAIVLDEQTADAGLQGSVDRRILARYVLPMTVGFAQGYFKARSETGTTQILNNGQFASFPTSAASSAMASAAGAVIAGTPAPTLEQAAAAGLAVGLQQAQTDVQRNAALPIRSATNAGAPMGILFRTAVEEATQ